MNTYTTIIVHNQRQRDLQRAAEAHRLARLAVRSWHQEQRKPLRVVDILTRIGMLF